ncbi:MAG TPA: ABC transporter permease subunit [Symbiobacteriaceae bacterium]|nr:ABC transporter permease subunit [Symbiobacteriaceae bacterium]
MAAPSVAHETVVKPAHTAATRVVSRTLRPYERARLWLSRLIIWVVCAAVLIPLLWVISASFTAGDAFFSGSLLPRPFTIDNYRAVFVQTNYLVWLKNSLLMAVAVGVIQAIVTALSAYAFARLRFRLRRVGLIALLLLQMFPSFLNLAALYVLFTKLELTDSLLGMALIFVTGNAFNIWVMKGFIDSIPRELDEAATVDGASGFQVFTKIILPLSAPMLAVQFLWAAVGVFNEYTLSSVLLQSPDRYIMGPGMRQFIFNQFSAHWTQFAAAAVLTSLPLVVLWLFLQRYIVSGLAGAVKG